MKKHIPALVGLALLGGVLAFGRGAPADAGAADEKVLKDAGVATDDAGLLAFLRDRTLSDDDRAKLAALIRRFGADGFAEREQASADLIALGPRVVAPLREAVKSHDAEIAERATRCLQAIGSQADRSAAVVRLLGKRRPDGAVEALARYAPFVDDDAVEEELLAALLMVGVKEGKADPVLTGMLQDPLAARRAAAGYVVGRAKDADQRAAAAKLLKDAEPRVRLRAAQGLVSAKERAAVPALIALLADAPPETARQAEDMLFSLAADQPRTPDASAGPEDRKKVRAAWAKWWDDNSDKVDLARASEPPVYLGLMLVVETHAGKVWEEDHDGKVRRQWENLQMPRDARVLPNGHLLVGEVGARRVTERDRDGTVLWTYPVKGVAYVERLANGNTFVGTELRAVEVTPEGKEVFAYAPEADFIIRSMYRQRDGHLLCLTTEGLLREVDRDGKVVRTLNLGKGNWSGIQGLPGGRCLAVEFEGRVVELDRDGKVVWEIKAPRAASCALRLPTGDTLVCSYCGQRVVEVNPKGEVVWEKKIDTPPWRVHCR